MNLDDLLTRWEADPELAESLSCWLRTAPQKAQTKPLPAHMDERIRVNLVQAGIHSLFSHQAEAFEELNEGRNIIVATGTASGKTLCYDLPVLDRLLKDPKATALYIFPTKALAQDQVKHLEALIGHNPTGLGVQVGIYDGDTPAAHRPEIRKNARILITNPEMLHQGILPHHTNWKPFISGMRFVVIDEMHSYRGVFGSHIANLIRRLKRIAAFYGAYPQFVLTSATIGNPLELGEKLIGAPLRLIDQDGSPHGEKNFLIYNPPLVNEELGIRKSVIQSSILLATRLMREGIQSLVFARTRRTVEMILTYLQERLSLLERSRVRGYRSGYLKSERREIEKGFKDGQIRLVVSTSALELGIDIGDLESVLITGYPGSIARTLQQAGRAGRKQQTSLAVLLAAPDAMDQYLAKHPEYLTGRSPEAVLIDPDNLNILIQHLRCACFELPISVGDPFGNVSAPLLSMLLELLVANHMLTKYGERYFWIADQYPAAKVSLRSNSTEIVTLKSLENGGYRIVGEMDSSSAAWLVHPEAVYLHEAEPYLVKSLDLDNGVCELIPQQTDYYTIPSMSTQIEAFQPRISQDYPLWGKTFGDLRLLMQITGFKKYRWNSNEIIGYGDLEMPPYRLETMGFWISISDNLIESLRGDGLWLSDPNEYGAVWPGLRKKILARDGFTCRGCGATPEPSQLHVHHIQPFKTFQDPVLANAASNLVTLCHSCHQQAELNVRVRSGLAGAGYALRNLAPLLVMCDSEDLSTLTETKSVLNAGKPAIVIYDKVPGGIGLSERLYERHDELISGARQMIAECPCQDGCPACVGPMGEEGFGGKLHALALLKGLA